MDSNNNVYPISDDPYRYNDEIFIWGVKSWDDMTSMKPCFYTMNDIDLSYNESTKCFSLSVETIYSFKDDNDKCDYLNKLLNQFTEWMNSHNYPVDEKLTLGDVFHWKWNEFPSVSKAYAWFKFMVNAHVQSFK